MRTPPCQVTRDLNRYLAMSDKEYFEEERKEELFQQILAEKLDLLDDFSRNPDAADELMAEILENIDWEEIVHQIRVAFVTRTKSSDLWQKFIRKPLEKMAKDAAELQFLREEEIEKENRELRGYYD